MRRLLNARAIRACWRGREMRAVSVRLALTARPGLPLATRGRCGRAIRTRFTLHALVGSHHTDATVSATNGRRRWAVGIRRTLHARASSAGGVANRGGCGTFSIHRAGDTRACTRIANGALRSGSTISVAHADGVALMIGRARSLAAAVGIHQAFHAASCLYITSGCGGATVLPAQTRHALHRGRITLRSCARTNGRSSFAGAPDANTAERGIAGGGVVACPCARAIRVRGANRTACMRRGLANGAGITVRIRAASPTDAGYTNRSAVVVVRALRVRLTLDTTKGIAATILATVARKATRAPTR